LRSPASARWLGVGFFVCPDDSAATDRKPAWSWYWLTVILLMAASLPTADAFASIHDMQRRMGVVTFVLALLACFPIWWVLKRQLSPLVVATKILGDLAKKDEHPQPLPISKPDEIGQLIGGFNRLLEVLGKDTVLLRIEVALQKL